MDYNGQAIVKPCQALCLHDDIDLVSLLVESSKFWKILVADEGLVETKVDKKPYIIGLVGRKATLRNNVV
jgi:hypothetical protein